MPLTDTANHLPLYQWQLQLMYVASLLLHISHPKVSYGYALYLNVAAHTHTNTNFPNWLQLKFLQSCSTDICLADTKCISTEHQNYTFGI